MRKPTCPKKSAIYNEDCTLGMKRIADSCVDLVVTDPPFAIGFGPTRGNYNRIDSRVMRGYAEVKAENYYKFTKSWMSEAFRVLKDSGSMYVFSGWNNLKDILGALEDTGFTTINHIIWKYQFGVVTKKKFVTSHYHCLYVCKDEKKRIFYSNARFGPKERTNDNRSAHYADKEDVWSIKREYWTGDAKTPTKLPRELVEKILAYSSKKNDLVLDPFLGSGQVAVISKLNARKYVGFEVAPKYYDFAKKRLASGKYRLRA